MATTEIISLNFRSFILKLLIVSFDQLTRFNNEEATV